MRNFTLTELVLPPQQRKYASGGLTVLACLFNPG